LTVILLLCVLLGPVPPVGAQDPEPRDPKFTQVPPAPDRPPEVLVLEELGPEAVRTEVVIEAADDAYISSNFPAERLGRGTSLYLGYDATAPAFGAQRILLKFNLPTTLIPRDATINRARVRLYMARAIPPNDAPMRTHLRLLGSAWDEATVTWPGPTWASAPIPGITLDTAACWKAWDVTDIVEDWVRTPSSNFGLELFGEEEAFEQEREFVASEAAGGNYPRLIVDFTADKAAPVTTVQALPATSSRTFTVSWGGNDPGGSGIAHYDVQYRVNEGEWVAWLNRVTFRSREFSGDRWNRYEFRVRATDRAGNVEAFGAGEARTVIPANQETLLPGSEADFNADGTADILWRDVDDGWVYAYLMNRGTIAGQGGINRVADRSWDIVGVADFNGDRRTDILWRDVDDGWNYLYLMNGTTIAGQGYINRVTDRNWQVAGVGDFNGDGLADILWRNRDSGWNYLYLMNGTTIIGQGYINRVSDRSWQIVGVADFNGDRRADILWRDTETGWNYLYVMVGTSIVGQGFISQVRGDNWKIIGADDFNGDRLADILWRDTNSGWN
ncbi:MAG TPA: DNRLRE domain-containing protein, partial [Ardenticatenaceae bacterium]|nr:DNRLRE domain-containing protein [Ardenticatenaceae bacterium]